MNFAAVVWWSKRAGNGPSVQHAKLFDAVQSRALKAICGCKGAAAESLQLQANLWPSHLRLEFKAQSHALKYLRISTEHPLASAVAKARQRKGTLPTTLQERFDPALQACPLPVELHAILPLPPWYGSPHHTYIAATAELAKTHHDLVASDIDILRCYTDGSLIEDCFGAGLAIPQLKVANGYHLGKTYGTVFASEWYAVIEAVRCVTALPRLSFSEVIIFIDSQAVIYSSRSVNPKTSQHLHLDFHEAMERYRRAHTAPITLQWIKAHTGVSGNEQADELAKLGALQHDDASQPSFYEGRPALSWKATRHAASLLAPLAPAVTKAMPANLASLKLHLSKELKQSWWNAWDRSQTSAFLKRLMRKAEIDDPNRAQLHDSIKDMHRCDATLIVKLRSNCTLNAYWSKFSDVSATCACGEDYETVEHFLLYCKLWTTHRKQHLIDPLGILPARCLSQLLITHTAEVTHFANSTGRFKARPT